MSIITKEKTLLIFAFSLLKFMPYLACGGIKPHLIIYRLRLLKWISGFWWRCVSKCARESSLGNRRCGGEQVNLQKARGPCLRRAEGPEHLSEAHHLSLVSYLAWEIALIYLQLGKQLRIGKNAVNFSKIHNNNADAYVVLCGTQSTFFK